MTSGSRILSMFWRWSIESILVDRGTTPTNPEKDRLTHSQQRLRRAMMTRLEHHTRQ